MQTLEFVSERRQLKIAQETLDWYVPLAHQLGMDVVRDELEELSVKMLSPQKFSTDHSEIALTIKQKSPASRANPQHGESCAALAIRRYLFESLDSGQVK